MLRNIVKIDEAKCDGCGLCATACAEGAIAIIDGKARLVKDQYCDGLGACLGECPQDAITIEQREAEDFDEAAVQKHLAARGTGHGAGFNADVAQTRSASGPAKAGAGSGAMGSVSHRHVAGGCPGAAAMSLGGCPGSAARSLGESAATASPAAGEQTPSQLRNWPLQLKLVSPMAPYLDGAKLCIAADCTAFAYPDFHRDMLAGKVLLIACPKLDDAAFYAEKLAGIFRHNDVRSIEVVYMEVPCCFGLVHLVRQAIAESGKVVPLILTKVGIEGGVVERVES